MPIERVLPVLALGLVLGWYFWPEPSADRRSRTDVASEPVRTLPAWPPALDDANPDRRRAAADELRKQGDAGVEIFIQLLRRGDAEQQILAARSLGAMGRGGPELLAALDPNNKALCLELLKAVERIGTKEDRWALPLLAHEDAQLRLAALQLIEARDADVVSAVADLIDPTRGSAEDDAALDALGYAPGGLAQILAAFENLSLRQKAIEAVMRMGPAASPATSALVQVIRDEVLADEEEGEDIIFLGSHTGDLDDYYAAGALAAIGGQAMPEVVAMLRSDLGGVRNHAAMILGTIGDAALPALVAAASDASPRARSAAADAFSFYSEQHPELLGALATLSKDSDESVRISALESLGKFGRPATPALMSALLETDAELIGTALDSLRDVKANDPRLIPHLARLLDHEDHNVQWGAADAIGAMGSDAGEGITVLVAALDSADHFLGMSITKALVAIGPAALPVLVARVDGASVSAQAVALQVFSRLGAKSPDVHAACGRLLQSPSLAIRVRAAAFLARFGAHRAAVLTILRKGLQHNDRAIRAAAVDGLRRMGTAAKSALPDVIRMAQAEGEREGNAVHVYDALAAVGAADIPQLIAVLASDSWNAQYDASKALETLGAPAVPHLVACDPSLREHVIPILQCSAETVPASRAALALWAKDARPAIRMLALKALWKGTWDARAVVPGLIALAPTNKSAAYLLSTIGSRAAFAIDDLRALYAKTKQPYIATAIQKIEQR